VAQREQVKQWIKLCKVKGMSAKEITDYVNQHLPDGCSYTTRGIEAYLIQIKKESRNWIDKMAFDVFEFVYELKERWDNLKELNRIQWKHSIKLIEKMTLIHRLKYLHYYAK
jgi:hypothetical protein